MIPNIHVGRNYFMTFWNPLYVTALKAYEELLVRGYLLSLLEGMMLSVEGLWASVSIVTVELNTQ